MLIAGIGHHVREEENDLFPKLRRQAGGEIAALGDAEDHEEAADAMTGGRTRSGQPPR